MNGEDNDWNDLVSRMISVVEGRDNAFVTATVLLSDKQVYIMVSNYAEENT